MVPATISATPHSRSNRPARCPAQRSTPSMIGTPIAAGINRRAAVPPLYPLVTSRSSADSGRAAMTPAASSTSPTTVCNATPVIAGRQSVA